MRSDVRSSYLAAAAAADARERNAAMNEGGDRLLGHLPLIERVVSSLARRKGLSRDEEDDFRSWLRVRLLEDGDAVLAKFGGRCRLSTYLTTVVHNLFRDYRIAKWGKWRPSAAARRLGTVAMRLETLLWRDGIGFDEAVEMLRRNHGVRASPAELADLAARLPPREPRRFEGDETLERLPAPADPERRVRDRELAATARRIEDGLGQGLAALPAEDRLILKMWVQDDLTVAAIARLLGLDQKPLYRRLEALLAGLRRHLEADGLTRREVGEVVDSRRAELAVDFDAGGGMSAPRPSNQEGAP